MSKTKIVQIAVAGVEENHFTQAEAIVYALDDEGNIWRSDNRDITKGIWFKTELPLSLRESN